MSAGAIDLLAVDLVVQQPLDRLLPYRPAAFWAPILGSCSGLLWAFVIISQQVVARQTVGGWGFTIRLESPDQRPATRGRILFRGALVYIPPAVAMIFMFGRSYLVERLALVGTITFALFLLAPTIVGQRRHFADRLSRTAPQGDMSRRRLAVVGVLLGSLAAIHPIRLEHRFLGPDFWFVASSDRSGFEALDLRAYRNAAMNFRSARSEDESDLDSLGGLCVALTFLAEDANARSTCSEARQRGARGAALGEAVLAAEAGDDTVARNAAKAALGEAIMLPVAGRILAALSSDGRRYRVGGLYSVAIPGDLSRFDGDLAPFAIRVPAATPIPPNLVFRSGALSVAVAAVSSIPKMEPDDAVSRARAYGDPLLTPAVRTGTFFSQRAVLLSSDGAVIVEGRSNNASELARVRMIASSVLIDPIRMYGFAENASIDNAP